MDPDLDFGSVFSASAGGVPEPAIGELTVGTVESEASFMR
jgi:hypothetical protein